MIIRADRDHLAITLQTDHATLSGHFARHWGWPLDPFAGAVYAAAHHDDGWYGWELAAKVNPSTGAPYNFTEMPLDDHLTLYRAGIAQVLEGDPYAGVLVSMHIVRLYRPRADHEAEVARFVAEQEALQRIWCDRLHPPGPGRAEFDQRLQVNHRLLAFWDRLSLAFSMHAPAELADGLGIPRLPLNYGGDEEHARMVYVGDGHFTLDPYPFDQDPLPGAVPMRRIAPGPYLSNAALRAALAGAPVQVFSFTLGRA